MPKPWDILDWIVEKGTKYAPILKTGVAALSTYASWKDQQKKNEMQQAAYDDFMAQAEAAGHEARAAIDINYTPMTVSGVPRTKADVTSSGITGASDYVLNPPPADESSSPTYGDPFSSKQDYLTGFGTWKTANPDELATMGHQAIVDVTLPGGYEHSFPGGAQASNFRKYLESIGQAPYETRTTTGDLTELKAAARGGLMSIPNKQRKRYASQGFVEDDEIEIMEPESLGDFELKQEEGVNIGEQVKYNTPNPREGAWSVWNSGAIDQEMYEFDFELFFDSGDWSDMLRGQVDVEGDMQMASSDMGDPMDNADEHSMRMFNGKKYNELTPIEIEIFEEEMLRLQNKFMATGGIAGLRHGGRPGYANSNIEEFVTADTEGVASEVPPSRVQQIEGNQMAEDAMNKIMYKFMEKFPGIDSSEMSIEDMIAMLQAEGVWETEDAGIMDIGAGMDMITPQSVRSDIPGVMRGFAQGGRIGYAQGSGIMNLGGLEKDYRTTGGFVPIGAYEKKDDVPARLSKNEFVMTADAVRAAGGGSINRGAQRMYDTMKNLEASPQSQRMIA